MSNIKCVKLTTGEDVLADFSTNNGLATLENVVQVIMVPSRTGEPKFQFIPFPIMSNDKKIEIENCHIMFVCEPSEDFLNQYNSIFGAGIIAPQKKLIV